MRNLLVMIAGLAAFSGCVSLSPEDRRAHVAPIGAVPEITQAATAFHLARSRWPRTKSELEAGLREWKAEPEFLSEIETVSVEETSDRSVVYRCTFVGGGSSEVRINLK